MGCAGSKDTSSQPVDTTQVKVAEEKAGAVEEGGLARQKTLNAGKRRVGVSAETYQAEDEEDFKPTIIKKSTGAMERITAATENNALFAGLSAEQKTAVIDAMFEVTSAVGQDVINQGDLGDNFYVADSGERAGLKSRPPTWQGGGARRERAARPVP